MEIANNFDFIVIGGGPAGYHFANIISKKGYSVALFEEKVLGGTCLNEGCIPSKSLLKSAKILDSIKHCNEYGIHSEHVMINQMEVVARKNATVSKLVMGVRGGLRKNKVKLFFTHATVAENRDDGIVVESDSKFYFTSKLVIATGSKVFLPPIEGLIDEINSGFVLTSKEILDIDHVPNRLVVIGGGVIGLEMASYFYSAGSFVKVIESTDKICGSLDRECSEVLLDNLIKRGMEVKLSATVTKIEKNGIVISHLGEDEFIECDKVLIATGRIANLDGFNIDKLGIEYTKRGIVVNDKMQTSNKNVFAIGDVNGKVMLAHTAYKEAEVCASSILGENNYVNYNNIPSVLYSTPECAWVGLSEQNISNFDNYEIKKLPMIYSGRFVAENLSNVSGLCKIIIDKSKNTIVGACLIGDGASEIILAISNLIELKVDLESIKKLVFPHPTIGEIIKEVINL